MSIRSWLPSATRHARATSGHPFVIGIGDDPEQLLDTMASNRRYEPELSKMGTDRIDYRGLLAGVIVVQPHARHLTFIKEQDLTP